MSATTEQALDARNPNDLMDPRQIRWQIGVYREAEELARQAGMDIVDVLRQATKMGLPKLKRVLTN
jgi:2,4-dienoyl-CoA reductase-like NADH-dependent reductase (Old Yellow Enzyme family)